MSGITTRFIARIRQNLESWRAGEIDHATFTDDQRAALNAIHAAGKRVEAEVVAALHGSVLLADVELLDDDDYRTVQLPPRGLEVKILSVENHRLAQLIRRERSGNLVELPSHDGLSRKTRMPPPMLRRG
jgi:nitroreductase